MVKLSWRCLAPTMMRVIQVGMGGFGRRWQQVIAGCNEVEWAAMVDVNPEPLEEARQRFGLKPEQVFTDYRAALEAAEADFVLIVVPPTHHREIALAAFDRGLPVLTEKPLADTMASAQEMVAAAEAAGLPLVVSQNYRYQRWFQTMRCVVAEGRLGRVDHLVVSFRLDVTSWGEFRHRMEDVLLVEMAIHHFDMMRCLLGRDAEQVVATTWNPGWSPYAGDPVAAVLILMEGGIPILYEATVVDRGVPTGWNGWWRVECEEGALIYEGQEALARHADDPPQEVELVEMAFESQDYLLRDFLACLREGREAETSGRDNLRSLAMVFAARDSAHEGMRPRDVAEYLGE